MTKMSFSSSALVLVLPSVVSGTTGSQVRAPALARAKGSEPAGSRTASWRRDQARTSSSWWCCST
uniref:cDNA clone:002-118-D09, full insert sequence n=1 Tax=Oryza sativa subsp. japonica TaxID=39947 RepID=B7EZR6_ORYSJ|nr:unnamed protein product [Oryza sativa Japonica Group]